MSKWGNWCEQVIMVYLEREEQLHQKSQRFATEGNEKKARELELISQRLGSALTMALTGKVSYEGDGVFLVQSRSEKTARKTMQGLCDCPAQKFKVQCTHRLAAYLYAEGTSRYWAKRVICSRCRLAA